MRILAFLLFAVPLVSSAALDVTKLPRDRAKEAWVSELVERLGLHLEVRVVRAPALQKHDFCAMASLGPKGVGYITVDPACVTGVTDAVSVGVLGHELAHLWNLDAHRLDGASDSKMKVAQTQATEFGGFVLYLYGFSLSEALSEYAALGPDSASNYPDPAERRRVVEQGWRRAEALAKALPYTKRQTALLAELQERLVAGERREPSSQPEERIVEPSEPPRLSIPSEFSNAVALLLGLATMASVLYCFLPESA